MQNFCNYVFQECRISAFLKIKIQDKMHLYSTILHTPLIVRDALQYHNSLLIFKKTTFHTIQVNNKNYKSKEFVNRYILNLDLNTVTDDDSLMSNGNLFHNFGAATEYALSP